MRNRSIIAILLITLVAIPAVAEDGPPWDLRGYLSTYTDATFTWNFSAVRHRFVCPYCGYSTTLEDPTPDGDYTCPNPFAIAGHPAGVQLVDANPLQRVLGELQVEAADEDGSNLTDDAVDPFNNHPLVGRPFHPGRIGFTLEEWADPAETPPWEDPQPGDVASFLTARVGGDLSGVLTAANYGLRFLVVKPGSVRPAAQHRLLDATNATTGDQFFRPTGVTGAENYSIFINPFRVSDGDVWYIRHREVNAGGATTAAVVEAYSTLYGLAFDSGGAIDLTEYDNDSGCRIITDDGALVVDIPKRLTTDGTGTWIIKLIIDSNTQTLPRPEEVNYDLWEPLGFIDIYGAGQEEPTFPDTGWEDIELSDISAPKEPYYIATDPTANPILSTADDADGDYPCAEKVDDDADGDPNFNTDEIWPYRMPPEAAGVGRVMLQWSPRTAAAISHVTMGGKEAYFRTGNEWHYLVDPTDPGTALVTNAHTAANTPLPDGVVAIDSYFTCSRLDVARTGDAWAGRDPEVPAESDTEAATGGHARIIIGQYQDPVGGPTGWVGQYGPGTRTPARLFALANRTPVRVLECPVTNRGCGARYQAGQPLPPGGAGNAVLDVGSDCPACGRPLVAARGEADVCYDGHGPLSALVNGNLYRMMAGAFSFGPTAFIPIGAPDFVQEVSASIPPYQPPSVPAGGTPFANDLNNDFGYRGTMVVFNRPDGGDPQDTNASWDAYYLSPATGKKCPAPDALTVGPADAQWVCSVCGVPYRRNLTSCGFCGHTFSATDDLPDPYVPHSTLVAEEFDAFGVQVSVLRDAALAAQQRVVDLGWIAPGTPDDAPNTVTTPATVAPGSDPVPTDVSDRSDAPLRNEGNIPVPARMRAAPLMQTGVDPAVRSLTRWAQTVPITVTTLFRYRPGPSEFGDTDLWGLLSADATGAAGQAATALLQAGIRSGAAEPYPGTTKPVPLGQPVGNYAADVLLFLDLNGDGTLNFYDVQTGLTNRPYTEFDPEIDEPFEPVVPFTTRARVVESRLPQSDFYSKDITPTLLYDETLGNMQVIWVGQRAVPAAAGSDAPAGTSSANVPPSTAPWNLLYANAAINSTAPAANDPLYRGWLWSAPGDPPDDAAALSVSDTPDESNSSPTAWVDAETGNRWVMWHRSQTSAAGVSSQLRFDSSTGADWDGSSATEFIFGSGGAHSGLTGFVREGAANAHWLLWHAGPTGREHLRYRWEWDPNSGTVPRDQRLMVTNASTGQRIDFFEEGGTRYRKPALDPFTYVKEAGAFGTTDAAGVFQLDVLYTGHIRALGNSDICWSRFRFGDPTDPDFPFNSAEYNFGKAYFPRVAGETYGTTASRDARNMPAIYDANGDVRGYPGEQLESSPRRESFQARDIDWLVTYEYQNTTDGVGPDWYDWTTAGVDLTEYDDPLFYVGVVTDDGATRRQNIYAVDWSRGSYNPATGLYTVMPRLVELTDSGLAELDPDIRPAVWHPYDDSGGAGVFWRDIGGVMAKALLSPALRREATDATAWDTGTTEQWPAVTLTINPASGMVQWSHSLFNPDNRFDPLAVFNEQNTPNIVDVVMYADYTPFIRRATTDRADDDSPSAFWNAGDSGRLTIFWRRSYGDTDTPHFGRPSFLHRTYTRSIQVGRPPVGSVTEVLDLTLDPAGSITAPYNLASAANGVIEIAPDPLTSLTGVGHRIAVTYTDGAGISRTEQHRVIGWSLETPVPINAVTSEGPLRVIPEVYEVDPGTGNVFNTVRYWLAWASPRGVYDIRPAANDGQRVHESADIYLAVVAPDHSSLIADLQVPRLQP